MRLQESLSTNYKSILYLFTTLVLPVSVSSYLSFYIIKNESLIHSFSIFNWAIVFFISIFTMALAITPTTFVAMVCGYFLGLHSVPWLIIAYTLASLLGFSLAKNIGSESLKSTIAQSSKLQIIINGLKEHEKSVIFLTRISPILPFAFINGVLGILDCNIKKFIIIGTLGMLPRTILFIYIGNEVNNVVEMFKSGKSMSISQIVFYVLLGISVLGMFWVFGKIAQKLNKRIADRK